MQQQIIAVLLQSQTSDETRYPDNLPTNWKRRKYCNQPQEGSAIGARGLEFPNISKPRSPKLNDWSPSQYDICETVLASSHYVHYHAGRQERQVSENHTWTTFADIRNAQLKRPDNRDRLFLVNQLTAVRPEFAFFHKVWRPLPAQTFHSQDSYI